MESKEDSIKILEMRIRQQMNHSLQKNVKPENIKYYMPSAALPQPNLRQEPQRADTAGAGPESDPAADGPRIGMPLTDSLGEGIPLSDAPKAAAPPSDVPEPVPQKAEVNLPVGAEYIDRAVGALPMAEYEHIEIPESKEVQHAKALTGYETSRSLDRKGTFRMEDMHFLDAKG